jgi:hypothetical protein
LTSRAARDSVLAMPAVARVDVLLSTLNATEVGSIDSVVEKLRQVEGELRDMEQDELAARAGETRAALLRGDVAEFRRGRAFLQSKIGHLR